MNTLQGMRAFSPKYDKELDEPVMTFEFWHETDSSKKNEKFTIPDHVFYLIDDEIEEIYEKMEAVYRHIKEISVNIDATK